VYHRFMSAYIMYGLILSALTLMLYMCQENKLYSYWGKTDTVMGINCLKFCA
jgi:hypothetical protein